MEVRTLFQTDSITLHLAGTIDELLPEDRREIDAAIVKLKSRHDEGIICFRTSKKSDYKNLTVQWRSKPELTTDP